MKTEKVTQPQPQPSAEDVALVDALVNAESYPNERDAWQRIRASLEVSNG